LRPCIYICIWWISCSTTDHISNGLSAFSTCALM
jgi:hypothetical protein